MAIQITKTSKPPKTAYDKHLEEPTSYKSVPAVGTVSATKKVAGEAEKLIKDEQQTVHPGIVLKQSELCMVTVGGGTTIATAPYENVKLSVSLSMPCKREELEETYDFVTNWVSMKMEAATKQIKE